jgi:hypothetical protein
MSLGLMPCAFNSRTRRRLYRGRTALVDAGCLRLGNALELALAPQIRLELGEHPQHVEEALAGAVPVSIGCSVAFRTAPRTLTVRR